MIDENARRQAKAYRARWKRVAQFQIREMRRTNIQARWRELNAIFAFAFERGWLKSSDPEELAHVRARWARLKANYP